MTVTIVISHYLCGFWNDGGFSSIVIFDVWHRHWVNQTKIMGFDNQNHDLYVGFPENHCHDHHHRKY